MQVAGVHIPARAAPPYGAGVNGGAMIARRKHWTNTTKSVADHKRRLFGYIKRMDFGWASDFCRSDRLALGRRDMK